MGSEDGPNWSRGESSLVVWWAYLVTKRAGTQGNEIEKVYKLRTVHIQEPMEHFESAEIFLGILFVSKMRELSAYWVDMNLSPSRRHPCFTENVVSVFRCKWSIKVNGL